MKILATLALATLSAGPAFAHGGAHLHPHGVEIPMSAIIAALAAAAALAGHRMR